MPLISSIRILLRRPGAHLVSGSELFVENDRLYYKSASGAQELIGAVYRRISDEYLDPMNFNPGITYRYTAYL